MSKGKRFHDNLKCDSCGGPAGWWQDRKTCTECDGPDDYHVRETARGLFSIVHTETGLELICVRSKARRDAVLRVVETSGAAAFQRLREAVWPILSMTAVEAREHAR